MGYVPPFVFFVDETRVHQAPQVLGERFQITIEAFTDLFHGYPRLLADEKKDRDPAVIGNTFEVAFKLFWSLALLAHAFHCTTSSHP